MGSYLLPHHHTIESRESTTHMQSYRLWDDTDKCIRSLQAIMMSDIKQPHATIERLANGHF